MAGIHAVATFRTLGNAATTHDLFSLENTSGAPLNIVVRRLLVQADTTAVLTAQMPQVKTHRCPVPTGGTTLTKMPYDTAGGAASMANAIARGATASDGGGATAITSSPGTVAWQQYCARMHTLVGQVLAPDNNLLPSLVETMNFVLRPTEALVVRVLASVGTSNPATNHWFVNCVWEEL